MHRRGATGWIVIVAVSYQDQSALNIGIGRAKGNIDVSGSHTTPILQAGKGERSDRGDFVGDQRRISGDWSDRHMRI